MMLSRWSALFTLCSLCLISSGLAVPPPKPGDQAPPAAAADRLGILLDVSVKMGHLVPQIRKEVRFTNERLKAQGRPEMVIREVIGANLDKSGSFGTPPSKNAVFQLKQLFENDGAKGVYWITSLLGFQNDAGYLELDKLLSETTNKNDKPRQLIIRNVWIDQIKAGSLWKDGRGEIDDDPLHPKNFPQEWMEPLHKHKGLMIRDHREAPEFFRTVSLNPANRSANDGSWQVPLVKRYRLHFARSREFDVRPAFGRLWLENTTLTPFIDLDSRAERIDSILEAMSARPPIEWDLKRIEGKKVGVLLSLGFSKKGIRYCQKPSHEKPGRSPSHGIRRNNRKDPNGIQTTPC